MMTMGSCEQFQEAIWDHLYGLLEPHEEETLRLHLDGCVMCQAELLEAKKGQDLIARAAKVVPEVPAFILPADEPAVPATSGAMAQASAVLPLPAPRRRRPFLRALPWVAAAACLALAAWGHQAYEARHADYQRAFAQAKSKVQEVDTRLAAAITDFGDNLAKEAAAFKESARAVQVLGPAQYNPASANTYNITVHDSAGNTQKGLVLAQVTEPASHTVLYECQTLVDGTADVVVPSGLKTKSKELHFAVQTRSGAGMAKVEEALAVTQPSFAMHLATNKSTYQVFDNLFFRTLILERFSLKPPTEAVPLQYLLRNEKGQTVLQLAGQSGPGGIGGGEFALTPNLTSGNYILEVLAVGAWADKVQPQGRLLQILHEPPAVVQLDRSKYRGGDKMKTTLNLPGQRSLGNAAKGQVTVQNVKVDGKPVPANGAAAGKPVQLQVDAKGNAPLLVQLPKELETSNAIMEIELQDGNKLTQSIPVIPSKLAIDFFPEGGDLVAGLPSQVYFRVRTPAGDPVAPAGKVTVLGDKEVIFESEVQQGQGVFRFTPKLGAKYSVRLTSPAMGATELDGPFEKLIKTSGTVLHVPAPVSGEAEPLALVLRNHSGPRRLLLIATCRGQMVGQHSVDVADGSTTVKLRLVDGANGVVRITLLDASGPSLKPLAERLVYRTPARRLDLALTNQVAPSKQEQEQTAGAKVQLQFQACDEKGKQTPAWFFGLVVDERVKSGEVGLPAQFYLLNEVPSAEGLEDANILVQQTPESRHALDLFLGIAGWRRFVQAEPLARLAKMEKASTQKDAGLVPWFFTRESTGLEQQQASLKQKLERTELQLRLELAQHRSALQAERAAHVRQAQVAALALADLEALPAQYLRLGCGIAAVVLLGIGTCFLAWGLIQTVRRVRATVPFAVALVNVSACIALFVVSGQLPAPSPLDAEALVQALIERPLPHLPEAAPAPVAAKADHTLAQLPAGFYSGLIEESRRQGKTGVGGVAVPPTAGPMFAPAMESVAKKAQNANSLRYFNSPMQTPAKDAFLFGQNTSYPDLQNRFQFNQARQESKQDLAAKTPALAPAPPAAMAKSAATKGAAKPGEAKAMQQNFLDQNFLNQNFLREFSYANPVKLADFHDPLLWAPALFASSGKAHPLPFHLPHSGAFRVFVFAHDPEGRLGHLESSIEVGQK